MVKPENKQKIRQTKKSGIRLGLCCIFRGEPIRFRSVTARYLGQFSRTEQLRKISDLCLHNSRSLLSALAFLQQNSIGAFRILSPFFPRYTHPAVGYTLDELPEGMAILGNLRKANHFRQQHNIRLSFHPDQFIILSSPREEVVHNSILELEYQAMLAEYVGADVINIHGGGAYNDKKTALERLKKNFELLSSQAQQRLSLENDDRIYSVVDLVPVCEELRIPLVYDVHHHRCHPDGLTVQEASALAVKSWDRVGREPYFHISSPANGWESRDPRPHADFIDPADFPEVWMGLNLTVDVEAKAKELAVLKLQQDLTDF